MNTRLIISLEEFPPEGLHLVGELDAALFSLDEGEDVMSVSPLRYDLQVQLFETELLVHGSIEADFRFRCVRCLSSMDYTMSLDSIALSEDVSQKLALDVTDELRDELLLELPHYPKCEMVDANCEINHEILDFRLDKDPQTGVESATASRESVWDALDELPNHD